MDVTDTLGRPQTTNLVSESGLYSLVFLSRKAEAVTFRRWVTKEVLPSIRKNGYYAAQKTLVGRYLALVDAFQRRKLLPYSAHKTALKLINIIPEEEFGESPDPST